MEKRFDRLEKRVDEVKDEVSELKTEFQIHRHLVEEHVTGDNKIIQKIEPLLDVLPSLQEIVQEYHLDKLDKKRSEERRKLILDKIKIVSGLLGIIGAISVYFLS
jgi:hypothetical protein